MWLSVTDSFAASSSSAARTVTVCVVSQLSVVKVSVFWSLGVLGSVSSTVTPSDSPPIVTVTAALGSVASFTVYVALSR